MGGNGGDTGVRRRYIGEGAGKESECVSAVG